MTTTITITGWEFGSFDSSNGENVSADNRVRTTCVLHGGSIITLNIEVNDGSARFKLGYFDGNDDFMSATDWLTSGSQLRLPDNTAWFKITVRYSDDRTMSISDLTRSEYVYDPWYVSEGRLKHEDFADLIEPLLSPPYPPEIWTVSNGRLTNGGLIDLPNNGAFADCTSLVQVSIPRTMEKIGEQSFINTNLTAVTIPADCEYSDTTFPPRCIINYYIG